MFLLENKKIKNQPIQFLQHNFTSNSFFFPSRPLIIDRWVDGKKRFYNCNLVYGCSMF